MKVSKWSSDYHLEPRENHTFFFPFFFWFNVAKPFWKVSTFQHLSHRLFSEVYLKDWKWSFYHHPTPYWKHHFFYFFFWFKVSQTPQKSMHLSPFKSSVIFRRIPKSLKMVLWPPPSALMKTPHFLFYFFCFKVSQTHLKSMRLSPFVSSVIFGRIPKSLKMVQYHHIDP